MEKVKIMIIDDDEKVIKVLQNQLEDYHILGYTDVSEALRKLKNEHVEMIILDYLLVDIRGDEVVRDIRKITKDTYIFLLTGCVALQPLDTLKNLDIQFYCEKGVDIESIVLNIVGAIKSIEFRKQSSSLGTRLKRLREEKNISQKEIAEALGVGRTTITNWESDIAEPGHEKLRRMSAFYRVSIDYLLGNDFFL